MGQIKVLTAFIDICASATVVVSGSHRSHVVDPAMLSGDQQIYRDAMPAGKGLMTQDVHLEEDDALMFTDAITNGSSPLTDSAQRRVTDVWCN